MSVHPLPVHERSPAKMRARSNQPAWLRHLGLLNDYVRVPYANGSSFASQFLYREFRARGHRVTVVGPDDPNSRAEELPEHAVCLKALPLRSHPGVRMPFPTRETLSRLAAAQFDLTLGQTNSELNQLGVWLRHTRNVPFVCVNTLHLRSAYNVLLPQWLLDRAYVRRLFERGILPWIERHAAEVYNQSDGLVVLAGGLQKFWRDRGVTVPIHVIPRSVDPGIFGGPAGDDPFDPRAPRGQRLLVICRHAREKEVARLLGIFARHVAPELPDSTLTLVGDGPEHDELRTLAEKLGVAARTFFTGEHPLSQVHRYYKHADLFVYASLSETYGQVVSEALWCGLPVVAFEDGMGVSDQIEHGLTGYLVGPGPNEGRADEEFGSRVRGLLSNAGERRVLGFRARERTAARTHPGRIVQSYYELFEHAREHCQRNRESFNRNAASSALARWTLVQAFAVGLGCIRRPPLVNRHGRLPPSWQTPSDAYAVRGAEHAAALP